MLTVNKFHHRFSGVETYYFALMALLQANGHAVAAFATRHPRDEPSPWAQHFVSAVDYDDARPWARLRAAGRALYSFEARRRLGALLRTFRPDVAHLQHIYHHLSLSVLDALAAAGVPIVQTLHDYWLVCPSRQIYLYDRQEVCERCRGGRFYNAVRYRCVRYGLGASALAALESYVSRWTRAYQRRVHFFLAPAEFLRQRVVASGVPDDRVIRLPYFIDTAQYLCEPEGRGVLYLGRLEPEKGPQVFVEAARRLPKIPFYIAGSGRLLQSLQARTKDMTNVTWLGHLNPSQTRAALRAARLVALPSMCHDVAPLVVLEAFASGKPVAASTMGGIPELVRDGETGRLVPPADADALAAAIAALYEQPARCAEMGRAGRRYVERHHQPERHYQALLRIYGAAQAGLPAPNLADLLTA